MDTIIQKALYIKIIIGNVELVEEVFDLFM